MNSSKSLCVFCGSSTAVAQDYLDLATQAGRMIARQNFTLVYGGSRIGLMGALADAALVEGGRVIGVIPGFLRTKEVVHTGLTELHLTETMHERQVGMAQRADAFMVLPGGYGTLAEFFEVLTWKQLGLHAKPVALLNGFEYWDSLIELTRRGAEEKFLRPGDEGLYTVLDNIENLDDYLTRLKKPVDSVLSST
jgi:uncharacterized protein (TIGR00730 family)